MNYALKSKDLKLKAYTLRTEYVQEIINAYYELEYEEEDEVKAVLIASIKDLKGKLENLEKTYFKEEVDKAAEGGKAE